MTRQRLQKGKGRQLRQALVGKGEVADLKLFELGQGSREFQALVGQLVAVGQGEPAQGRDVFADRDAFGRVKTIAELEILAMPGDRTNVKGQVICRVNSNASPLTVFIYTATDVNRI